MPKSYYLSNKVLDAALRSIAYTSPIAAYVALFTVAPTQVGGGTEVTGGGYARQTVAWNAPSSGQMTNSADVLYPVASVAWGTVVAFGVYDASSGGNLLYYNNLSAPRIVGINDQIRFPSGQLVASEQ
jgi:hypothetical protein